MMKKLIILMALALGFGSVNAQVSESAAPIVTYKIEATGYSNGLQLPNPHYFHVDMLSAVITEEGFQLYSYTHTSVDSASTVPLANDSIPELVLYPMTVEAVDTLNLQGMVQQYVRQNAIDVYGEGNVIKITQ